MSIRYGLMSRETSFVAVERRETPVIGDMQLRRIPIALTSGWGGIDMMRGQVYGAVASARPSAITLGGVGALHGGQDTDHIASIARRAAGSMVPSALRLSAPDEASTGPIARGLSRLRSLGRATPPPDQDPELTPSALTSSMLAVAALQRADGSWELTAELARAIGHDLAELEALLSGSTGKIDETRQAWATALALAWLENTRATRQRSGACSPPRAGNGSIACRRARLTV